MRPQHAIGLTTVAALAATAASATEHIQLVERALTDATVDLGTPGDSVGDLLTFSNPCTPAPRAA
jgi:hypothetical protein